MMSEVGALATADAEAGGVAGGEGEGSAGGAGGTWTAGWLAAPYGCQSSLTGALACADEDASAKTQTPANAINETDVFMDSE